MNTQVKEYLAAVAIGEAQTHKNLIAAANLVDVAAVVYARGKTPPEDVVALANRARIQLLGYEHDTWTLAKSLFELGVR